MTLSFTALSDSTGKDVKLPRSPKRIAAYALRFLFMSVSFIWRLALILIVLFIAKEIESKILRKRNVAS